jgi:hypothetical protein
LVARTLGCRDEREFHWRRVHGASRSLAGRVECRRAIAEGDDSHRPLVHTVRADERGDYLVWEAAVQPCRDSR